MDGPWGWWWGGRMAVVIESVLRAELPEPHGALALCAFDLARRLDAQPGDDAAVRIVRELRQVLGQLGEGTSADEVDALVARIAAPGLGHQAN